MTELEIKESQQFLFTVGKTLEMTSRAGFIKNPEIVVLPHERPGFKRFAQSTKSGYGFTLYAHYTCRKTGNDITIIEKHFNCNQPCATVYDFIRYYDYLQALNYVLDYLNKNFDLQKVIDINAAINQAQQAAADKRIKIAQA